MLERVHIVGKRLNQSNELRSDRLDEHDANHDRQYYNDAEREPNGGTVRHSFAHSIDDRTHAGSEQHGGEEQEQCRERASEHVPHHERATNDRDANEPTSCAIHMNSLFQARTIT